MTRWAQKGSSDRGSLRLGQDRRRVAQAQASGLPKVDFRFTLTFAAYNSGAAAHTGKSARNHASGGVVRLSHGLGMETLTQQLYPNPTRVLFSSHRSPHHSPRPQSVGFSKAD